MSKIYEIKENQKIIWKMYLALGSFLAIFLSAIDISRDGMFFIVLGILFMVIAGPKDIKDDFIEFNKHSYVYAIITIAYTVYFSINTDQLYFKANRIPFAIYFMVFLGYTLVNKGQEILCDSRKILFWVLLFFEMCAVVNGVISYVPGQRVSFAYMNAILEGDAVIYMLLLAVLFIDEGRAKLLAFGVSFMMVILTGNRMTLVELLVILVVVLFLRRQEIAKVIKGNPKKAKIIAAFAGTMIIIALVVLHNTVYLLMLGVAQRVVDVTSNDVSSAYRLFALQSVLSFVPDGNMCDILFGRGCMQGYYRLIDYAEPFAEFATQIGPVENTFVSLLYDYGIAAFVLYLGTFIKALITIWKYRHKDIWKEAVLVVYVMFASAFVDMQYWPNMCFLLFTTIGIFLGNIKKFE
ncbi:O-antigen ligase family protein [Butyrivibrio sp. AD3002]|uniref:O-antigen ligase family protein n=1 Tax=Butyrivibrio sp. AD3002 TaxID=1280670 RepID=UPI0003B6DAE1|nr:O-antigen ligase family protein [Butyrivibrio sp. AD3002]